MRISMVNSVAKAIKTNQAKKQEIEELAQDLVSCWPGYVSKNPSKVEKRAMQILRQSVRDNDKFTKQLKKEQFAREDALMPWNYQGESF